LSREQEARRNPDPRSWRVVGAKRRWLGGSGNVNELQSARAAAQVARRDALNVLYYLHEGPEECSAEFAIYCASDVAALSGRAWRDDELSGNDSSEYLLELAKNVAAQSVESAKATAASMAFQQILDQGESFRLSYFPALEAGRTAGKEAALAEAFWQRQHLAGLVLECFWLPFCQELSFAVEQLTQTIPEYYDELEDVLF